MKRAVIYVRVSSERQGEKASPHVQEQDCRMYCENKGYHVTDVYKDIERYRVGKKLVEPSGTRSDRPELKRMLADARAGKYDVVIAWREDRLYRSYRPMLEVLDCIDDTDIDIELVKENFDKRIAPIKAWAARMELDAKHDRFIMGVSKRLEKGKNWNTCPPYGYQQEGDYLEIDPIEGQWVERIFNWYASGESTQDIRRWLVEANAPQRKPDKVKHKWGTPTIGKILRYEPYWTGEQTIKWDGQEYIIQIPKIIDGELAEACNKRRAAYRTYPAGNIKHKSLAGGIAYCKACNTRMIVTTVSNGRTKNPDGSMKLYSSYKCITQYQYGKAHKCAGRVSVTKLDEQIWEKVWDLISRPGVLEKAIRKRVDELHAQEINANEEYGKLQLQLDDVLMERQAVIGWARKKIITESDLETQMMGLTLQEQEISEGMDELKPFMDNRVENLLELGELFRSRVKRGCEGVGEENNPERQFEYRQRLVRAIVRRVDVREDKTPIVHFVIPFTKDEIDIDNGRGEGDILADLGEIVCIPSQSTSSLSRCRHRAGR